MYPVVGLEETLEIIGKKSVRQFLFTTIAFNRNERKIKKNV